MKDKCAREHWIRKTVIGNDESGQSILEYVLVLAIVFLVFATVMRKLEDMQFIDILAKPLTKDFYYAYRYGHPLARGVDDGGEASNIALHPEKGFRIAINPPNSQ